MAKREFHGVLRGCESSVAEYRRRAVADRVYRWWGSLPLPARQGCLKGVSGTRRGKFAVGGAGKLAKDTGQHS